MIKSSYLFYFISLIKTKKHADEVIQKIDELKDSLYNKRIDLDRKMGELFSYEMKEKIKAYSLQEQINLNDPESFGRFLSDLRNHVKNLPVISITLAFEPTDGLVDEIAGWFTENFGKNVLIDFVTRKELVGGAVIIFNGIEKDFSLNKRLNDKYKVADWKNFIRKARGKDSSEKSYTPLKMSMWNNNGHNALTA